MLTARRAFTLVEVLVALVLFGIVGGAVLQSFVRSQRTFNAQLASIRLTSQTRAGAYALSGALRGLDAHDSDIVAMSPNDITIKPTVQTGFICVAPTRSSTSVSVRQSQVFGSVAFAARDSVLLYADNDTTTSTDDTWLHGIITTTSTGTCTDGSSALTLSLSLVGGDTLLSAVRSGALVRAIEIDRYALYADSTGQRYLGKSRFLSGGWTALDPVAGPFLSSTGLALAFYDTTGAVTTSTTAVNAVAITVRGQSTSPATLAGSIGTPRRDSVVTEIALRNNPHS